jgi:hypothetical protein
MHLGPHALLVVVSVEFAPGLDTAAIEAAVRRLHGRLAAVLENVTLPQLVVIQPASGPVPAREAA